MQWKKLEVGDGTRTGVNARNSTPPAGGQRESPLLDGAKHLDVHR
jgi:hypothetical protein